MTEVTPILENTRFSSIFEYNRFMTPLLFPRRVFLCIHSTFSSPTEKKYSTFSLTFLPITRIRAMEYASS